MNDKVDVENDAWYAVKPTLPFFFQNKQMLIGKVVSQSDRTRVNIICKGEKKGDWYIAETSN